MSTALYRRYRPETFDEVIGQEHVTDPLKAAIERGRINHAYLFSGPRGCGKTTSARILARCLNCAKGPTPVPCGECPSCEDLANGGSGSLDVVEIDAASHNGVDDARDLRERAIYAPARDRYKVFILDEAHMVTSQGFNALLKIVEEPPPHIKFIFATTEPEKVIGTIRSRTHHYPFRLVPPEALGNYMEDLCNREGVQVAKGVLPLVVRAGGGSVRDTLSVLDQLIAGSGPDGVDYAGAIALLGYTPDSLLSDIVDAFSAGDGGGVYRAVERVIESGQDPRRFVEDLLERMRDLIVINAAPEAAHAFLPEVPPDRLERLTLQARGFGQGELSRSADLLNQGLTEMSGATSPRLQLELICARILLPGSGRSRDAVLSRVERMERRIGMSASGTAANIPPAQPEAVAPSGDGGQSSSTPPAQGQSQGASGQSQPSPAPAAQSSNQAPPPSQAPRDDFDELAEMAAAAESMLNEPPASTPADSPQEDRSSLPEDSAQAAEAVADDRPSGRDAQHGDSPSSSDASHAQQPGAMPSSQEQPDRASQAQASQGQVSQAQAPADSDAAGPGHYDHAPADSAQSDSAQSDPVPQVRSEQKAGAQPRGSASADNSAPEGDAVAGAGHIGGEIEAIRRAWPSILAAVEKRSRLTRAIIAANAIPQSYSAGVVYLGFNNAGSVQGFQQRDHAAKLAMAINDVLGIQARIDIGDVGRIGGNSGQADAGRGTGGKGASASAPSEAPGNRGPAPAQRRPSPQEVAAVVGTREVDKPQVDHEKFWETSGSPQGPWSDDDEEGEQPASHEAPQPPTDSQSGSDSGPDSDATSDSPSADASNDAGDGPSAHSGPTDEPASREENVPTDQNTADDAQDSGGQSAPVEEQAPAEMAASAGQSPEQQASEQSTFEQPASDESLADSDIVVPDLSDEDFFSDPSDNTAPEQPEVDHRADPAPHAAAPEAQSAPEDAPMEYVQPRWEEPTWHDGPDEEAPNLGDSSDGETQPAAAGEEFTSAGSGAVEVGALVVPPPEDDDLDFLGDYADGGTGLPETTSQPPAQSSRPQGHGAAKPFKSRFAALAEKHGGSTPQPPAQSGENGYSQNGNSTMPGSSANDAHADARPQSSGADEDEYDPETDLDISDAPQIGVAVIARVLGGEIIDEREV
ncbi:MAG: DNA polymerase III subunit gamma and tau [Brevibacterium aurantiacum]|nr:DNA polymerase III subunit gamma and tau [Brevibacterium aurantiacum]